MPTALAADPLPLRKNFKVPILDDHINSFSIGQKPAVSLDFPVKEPKADVLDHEKPAKPQTHLKDDVTNIGRNLNIVNNELYHVLTELLNGQTAEFEYTLYNLRAKDYNAALPDRRRYIKPLRNLSTGIEHPRFFREEQVQDDTKEKGVHKKMTVPITIEALEALSNIHKEEILTDLGMEQDFNFLHNLMSGPKGPIPEQEKAAADATATAARKAKAEKAADDAQKAADEVEKSEISRLVDPEKEQREEAFNAKLRQREAAIAKKKTDDTTAINNAKTAEDKFTKDEGIAQYLFDLDPTEKADMEELYATYLTTQLRVAVGLARNYCP